jgi:hypothetical protein
VSFGVLLVDANLDEAGGWVEGAEFTTDSDYWGLATGLTILDALLTSDHLIGRSENDFTRIRSQPAFVGSPFLYCQFSQKLASN